MSSSNPCLLKHTSYRTNGSGRDMYIFSNNGGLITKHLTSNFDPMGFQQANRSIVTLPSIHSKTIHYGPDGTGRDTYIKTDEGGTMPIFTDYSPKRPDFISSLRFYQQQRNLNSRDFFSRSQFSLPTTELHKLQERVKVQKALTSRLTAPMKNSHCKLPAISIKT